MTETPTAAALERRLRQLGGSGALTLALPGAGRTAERFDALRCLGAADLSVARLAEAHTDALAILAEAGRAALPGTLYGVWAAGGPDNRVVAAPAPGGWVLRGTRHYCSGATILDRTLLPVSSETGARLLVNVDVHDPRVAVDASEWQTSTMQGTTTAAVRFDGVEVGGDDLVGPPGFYLERPGFWIGSVGVAAVWAGGAGAIVDGMRAATGADAHALAHLGAADALVWMMRSALATAAFEIDTDPLAPSDVAMTRALRIRHLVERAATEIVDRSARALGPGPLVRDPAHARRVAELQLYVRQTHAEGDLETLGRLVAGPR